MSNSIERFIAGYHRFRSGYYEENRERLNELAREGQSPRIAIVACCDSRVDPAVITDSNPGDMFVIRNVANLVPPYEAAGSWHGTSAALQFAVCGLEVEHLVVMGHAQCGGIRALLEKDESEEQGDHFIASWMSIADEAKQHVLHDASLHSFDDRLHACELSSIEISLKNLMTFSWIREKVEQGKLELHGWYYDIRTGEVLHFDRDRQSFKPL